MPKVLTIIVTYNGMQWLDKCLASLKNSSIPTDIFIVDNGSTDGSIELIEKIVPEATFIKSEENLGFGKANNIGLKYALKNGYDYVYLLNQDAWIEPDLLDKMIAASKGNPEYGILSPLQTNKEKTRLDKNFSTRIPPKLSSDLLCGQTLDNIYETDFTMAAHWLIPVDKLKIIGGFSPAFRHYGEDDNLIHRMIYKGFKIGIVPAAKGVHDRENRPLPLEKERYLNYVHTTVKLNNPNQKSHLTTLVRKTIGQMFGSKLFSLKYTMQSIQDYYKSKTYLKQYKEPTAFIN